MSRAGVVLSPNTRKRILTLSGRFLREHTPLKKSPQLACRKPITVFTQPIPSLTRMVHLGSIQRFKPCTDLELSNWFNHSTKPPLSKAKPGYSFTEGAHASVYMRSSSQSSQGTRSLPSLHLATTSSSRDTERTSSST